MKRTRKWWLVGGLGGAAWSVVLTLWLGCGTEKEVSRVETPTPLPPIEDRGRIAVPPPAEAGPASAHTRASPVLQFDTGRTLMALSADGRWIVEAGGAAGFEVRLWDVVSGAYRDRVGLKGRTAQHLGWAGDSPVVVTSGGRVFIWDLGGRRLTEVRGGRCAPDVVAGGPDGTFGLAGEGCVSIREDGRWIQLRPEALARADGLAFDSDLVVVIGRDPRDRARGWVWLRRVGVGGAVATQAPSSPSPAATPGPEPTPTLAPADRAPLPLVLPVSASGGGSLPPRVACQGTRIFVSTPDGRLLSWNASPSGLDPGPSVELPESATDVQLLPDAGRYLAVTGDGQILSGDIERGRPRWRGELPDHGPGVVPRLLTLSAEGDHVVVDLGRPRLLDLGDWRLGRPFPSQEPPRVTGLLWDAPLRRLVQAAVVKREGAEGLAVVVWTLQGRESPAIHFLENLDGSIAEGQGTPMGLSLDGRRVAVGAARHVYVLDVASGERYSRLPVDGAVAVAFHPDGESLYTISEQGEVRRWEVAGDETGEIITRYGERLTAAAGSVSEALIVAALGRHGRSRPKLELLATERRQVMRRLTLRGEVQALAPSASGNVVAGSFAPRGLQVWTVPAGVSRGKLTAARARAFALDALGKYLVFGKEDLRTWRVGSRRGRPAGRRLTWLPGELTAVAVAPRLRCVAAADTSGVVTIHDGKGRRRASLVLVDTERWLAFTENGMFAGVPTAFPLLRLRSGQGPLVVPDVESGLHDRGGVWRAIAAVCSAR